MEIRFVLCEVEGCEEHAEEWVGTPHALRPSEPLQGPRGLCPYHALEFKIHRSLERYIGPVPIEAVSHAIIGLFMQQISFYEDKAKEQSWNMVDCVHWAEKVKGKCPWEDNPNDCGNCQDYNPVIPRPPYLCGSPDPCDFKTGSIRSTLPLKAGCTSQTKCPHQEVNSDE